MKEEKRFFGHQLLLSVLITVLAGGLCLTLYLHNNKYLHQGAQAITGILFVSERDWKETPIRYLWNGWIFYPDVLLSPEEYEERNQEKMRTVQIGAYSNFAFGDEHRPAQGCGTYVMTLQLPKQEHTYAMELPEIFSSYRFYVGDRLVMEMGNPEEDAYESRIQSSLVTFEAAGTVRLLLAVRDKSHFYSGMIYPPAFGEPVTVESFRNARLLFSVSMVTVSFLFSLLALGLSFPKYRKQESALIYFFLCLVTTCFISYPVLHSLIAVGIHPWYTIELVSGYAITFLLLLLHNRLCQMKKWQKEISTTVAGAVCIMALLYSGFSLFVTQKTAALISEIFTGFKLFVTLYLLGTAFVSMRQGRGRAEPVFYVDIFYAAVSLCDYLMPAYEPIWGGWFQEWGCFVLVITLGLVLWYDVVAGYSESLTFAEERRQMEKQLQLQQEHYQQISLHVEESRRQRHDFRHHLRIILNLADDRGEQAAYINQIIDATTYKNPIRYCKDSAVDALLFYYLSDARESGIETEVKLEIPEDLRLPTMEYCTILGNLLENALEACQRQTEGERYIRLHLRWQYGMLYTVLDNSFHGQLRQSSKGFFSSKREGLGIGTQSVKELAEQLNGTVEFQSEEAFFRAVVILPIDGAVSFP